MILQPKIKPRTRFQKVSAFNSGQTPTKYDGTLPATIRRFTYGDGFILWIVTLVKSAPLFCRN
jgi:hypothetical protein